MSVSYDAAGFWQAVTHGGRAACWVCERLRELGVERVAHEGERCEYVSGGLPLDAHHLLAKQALKRELLVRHRDDVLTLPLLERVLADPRNGIPVRRFHHDALESRRIRIPRGLLPPSAVVFARELGLEALLERYYPEEV